MTSPLGQPPPTPKPPDIGRLFSHGQLPVGSACRWCWTRLVVARTHAGVLLVCEHCDPHEGSELLP